MRLNKRSIDLTGILLGLASSAAFGLIPLFSLPLMHAGVPVPTVLAYRFTIAALAMGVILKSRQEKLLISAADFAKLGFLSAMYLMAVEFFYEAFNFLPSGVTATIQFLYPVMVMLIMIFFFHEHFRWQTGLAILFAFLGVATLSLDQGGTTSETDLGIAWGVCLALLAGLTNALYFIGLKVIRLPSVNGQLITFYVMLFGSFFCVAHALASRQLIWIRQPDQISLALLLALITAVFSNLTLVMAIKRIGPTLTSILGVMEPLTAVMVGTLVFKEPFTWALFLGVLLIALAVAIVVIMPGKNPQ